MSEWRITADGTNKNNRRVHRGQEQWCKVYGFTPEEAQEKAEFLVDALKNFEKAETRKSFL